MDIFSSLSGHLSSLIQNDFDQVVSLKMTVSIVNVHISKGDIEQKHVHSLSFSFFYIYVISLKRETEREKKKSQI